MAVGFDKHDYKAPSPPVLCQAGEWTVIDVFDDLELGPTTFHPELYAKKVGGVLIDAETRWVRVKASELKASGVPQRGSVRPAVEPGNPTGHHHHSTCPSSKTYWRSTGGGKAEWIGEGDLPWIFCLRPTGCDLSLYTIIVAPFNPLAVLADRAVPKS